MNHNPMRERGATRRCSQPTGPLLTRRVTKRTKSAVFDVMERPLGLNRVTELFRWFQLVRLAVDFDHHAAGGNAGDFSANGTDLELVADFEFASCPDAHPGGPIFASLYKGGQEGLRRVVEAG